MTRSIDLYDLQETDTAIDAAERRLTEIGQELESEGNLTQLDEEIEQAQAALEEAERDQRANDAEVADARSKIADLEAKLYSGAVKLPRELKALQDDVQAHQRQLATLEERALAGLDRVQAAREALHNARKERELRVAERARLTESLGAERLEIQATLEQLRARRERQKERVDQPDMLLYERLRRARAGRAVAKVERGTCQGCRISLPTTVFQRARSGLKIVQCTSCDRILYVV
jgi:predicted  nucleic acid-binding Zn-ribbon protein